MRHFEKCGGYRAALRAVAVLAWLVSAGTAGAQDMQFFRIASGSAGGTYFPISGIIAQIISNPPGARNCGTGGNCGVPGLIATGQSAEGSVANARSVAAGAVESGFVQSDVTQWAYSGTGPFKGESPLENLRVIASLYPEHVHVVVSPALPVTSIAGLKDKAIVVGQPDSGILVAARTVLGAYGLKDKIDYESLFVDPTAGAGMIQGQTADAMVTVMGYPSLAIAGLTATGMGRLLPIDGKQRETLLQQVDFYSAGVIPGGTYANQPDDLPTIAVTALWLTRAEMSESLVYGIVKALFDNPQAAKVLREGHVKAREITAATALEGVSIPLHPGAERYFREAGLLQAAEKKEAAAEGTAK